jgi:hypothetical protein
MTVAASRDQESSATGKLAPEAFVTIPNSYLRLPSKTLLLRCEIMRLGKDLKFRFLYFPVATETAFVTA